MPYIASDGTMRENKPLSLKYFQDLFWGILTFVILFFRGLFHLDDPKSKGLYGRPPAAPAGGRNGRLTGNPGRRMGGIGGASGPSAPPCAPGGG